jgi:hypothetical protein
VKTETSYRQLKAEMRATLEEIKEETGGDIWEADPEEGYGWHLTVGAEPDGVDVTLTIEDAVEYGDYEKADQGATIGLRAVKFGGEILGVVQPYNYTPDCWVELKPWQAAREEMRLRLGEIRQTIPDLVGLIAARREGSEA